MSLLTKNAANQEYAGDFACERVPALAEALALIRGRLFVDLDTETDRIDLVVAAIVAADVIDQVFVSVSDPAKAVAARTSSRPPWAAWKRPIWTCAARAWTSCKPSFRPRCVSLSLRHDGLQVCNDRDRMVPR